MANGRPPELDAEHRHPRHPKEQDVESRSTGPRSDRRPSAPASPGPHPRVERPARRRTVVEHVGSCRSAPPNCGHASDGARHVHAPVLVAVPHRDARAPPELARDRPVADVLHPVEIRLVPRAGTILILPLRTALMAGSASGLVRTYHCSTRASPPPLAAIAHPRPSAGRGSIRSMSRGPFMPPRCASGLEASRPAYLPAQLGHPASKPMTLRTGDCSGVRSRSRWGRGRGYLDDAGCQNFGSTTSVGHHLQRDVPLDRGHLERLPT